MHSSNGIHTVLFDLDGTLRHSRPDGAQTFLAKAVELGLPLPRDARRRGLRWTYTYWADSDDLKQDQGTYAEDDLGFWLNFTVQQLKAFGCPANMIGQLAPAIHAFMSEEFDPEDFVPEEVPLTLAQIKEAGFRTAVVSNRNQPFGEYLEEIGLSGYFDFSLAAGEVNSWKPDPEIFHHALQRADSSPEQAVYIGDNYYADVVGARRAGIRPILLDPEGIFADADCEVISRLDEVVGLLA